MDDKECLRICIMALKAIANFGHVDGCNSPAPVHECGCYEKDEKEIAQEALRKIDF